MIGQNFTVETDYSDDTTLGPYGYPIQVAISVDNPVFMQFKTKRNRWSRPTWDILSDVPYPQGDYRFGRVYGIKFKQNGDTPAVVYVISVFKEDPVIQGFSPSN